MIVTYYDLIKFLSKQNIFLYKFNKKGNYIVLSLTSFDYHITIFKDQWDMYESVTKLPYHLFHISEETTDTIKCSVYFWMDKHQYKTHDIPQEYFQYNQTNFDYGKSRRSKCVYDKSIKHLLKTFEKFVTLAIKNKQKKQFVFY